jgi:hypothetical protein
MMLVDVLIGVTELEDRANASGISSLVGLVDADGTHDHRRNEGSHKCC